MAEQVATELDMIMALAMGGLGGVGYCYAMGVNVGNINAVAECAAIGAVSGFALDYVNEMTGDYIPLIDQTTYVGSVASGFVGAAIVAYARARL